MIQFIAEITLLPICRTFLVLVISSASLAFKLGLFGFVILFVILFLHLVGSVVFIQLINAFLIRILAP